MEETVKKKKRKINWKLIYILATVLVIVLIAIFDEGVKDIVNILPQLNVTWILASVGLIVLYWIFDAVILGHITSYVYHRQSWWKTLKVGIIGLYYSALTPFATGGQPLQVAYMKRDNIPIGTSTCIVSIKFFLYELALCVGYLAAMIFMGAYIYQNFTGAFWFILLGFFINFAGLMFIVISLISKRFATKVVHFIIKIGAKIRLIKRPEEKMASVQTQINEFSDAAKYISGHKFRIFISFLLTILDFVFLFSIPYVLYIAFGLHGATYIEFLVLQMCSYLAVAFMPTPGAAGASEGAFYLIFSRYFNDMTFLPMLIWRFLTYYLILFVGSIWVVLDQVFNMKKSKNGKQAQAE